MEIRDYTGTGDWTVEAVTQRYEVAIQRVLILVSSSSKALLRSFCCLTVVESIGGPRRRGSRGHDSPGKA